MIGLMPWLMDRARAGNQYQVLLQEMNRLGVDCDVPGYSVESGGTANNFSAAI